MATNDWRKGDANFIQCRVSGNGVFRHEGYVGVRCVQEKVYCLRTRTNAIMISALPIKSIAVSISPKANQPAVADKAGCNSKAKPMTNGLKCGNA